MSRLAIALISTLALTFTPGIYARGGHSGGGHHAGHHGGHHEHHGEHRHEHHGHHDRYEHHHGYYDYHGNRYYYGVEGGVGLGVVNYYYGPGINQHWCANHPGKCARWCANHPHRCNYNNGTYFIVSP